MEIDWKKIAEQLAAALDRLPHHCETLRHYPHEDHNYTDVCPALKVIQQAQDAYYYALKTEAKTLKAKTSYDAGFSDGVKVNADTLQHLKKQLNSLEEQLDRQFKSEQRGPKN